MDVFNHKKLSSKVSLFSICSNSIYSMGYRTFNKINKTSSELSNVQLSSDPPPPEQRTSLLETDYI